MSGQGTAPLASQEFWEQEYYWSDVVPPCRPDPDLPFDRALGRALAEMAPARPDERVLEIGCAPAKWLAFYGERFGAWVEGIEYSEKGADLSRANLAACGVPGAIRHADFFAAEPEGFDLVVSLGFIEHFDDLEGVFARHVEWVRPGGRLLLGVPNFRGWNRVLQSMSDRAYLELHNLRAMDPGLYRRLAAANGLRLDDLRYVGGFDPIIVKLSGRLPTVLAMAEARWRRLRVSERINHRWLSPYLLGAFTRPPS